MLMVGETGAATASTTSDAGYAKAHGNYISTPQSRMPLFLLLTKTSLSLNSITC